MSMLRFFWFSASIIKFIILDNFFIISTEGRRIGSSPEIFRKILTHPRSAPLWSRAHRAVSFSARSPGAASSPEAPSSPCWWSVRSPGPSSCPCMAAWWSPCGLLREGKVCVSTSWRLTHPVVELGTPITWLVIEEHVVRLTSEWMVAISILAHIVVWLSHRRSKYVIWLRHRIGRSSFFGIVELLSMEGTGFFFFRDGASQ